MTKRVLLVSRPMRPATLDRLRAVAATLAATLVIDRRDGADRRASDATDDQLLRRDRRIGERRAAVRELPLTARLPVRLLSYRAGLRLVERMPLPAETLADREALRLLMRHAEGDPHAARTLFESWFDRAYAYLSGWLGDTRGAQVAAQAAFLALLRRASTFDPQRASFRVMLVDELHAASGLDAAIARVQAPPTRGRPAADDGVLERLARLNQLDLYIMLARLTADERRVVMLRHVLKLDAADAARAVNLAEHELVEAEDAALRRLLLEVQRIGHADSREGERVPMRAVARLSPVVRSRRAALALRA